MIKPYYSIEQEERSCGIFIYGDITSWPWLESDTSAYLLSTKIAGLDVDTIDVYINSYGGEVAEGLAIHNALQRHKAKVTTYCDGFACSAASVVFMAGERRLMNAASMLMIHNAWSYASGNAAELREEADKLEKISNAAANAYREKITISEEELKSLLDAESWIEPEEAVSMGFATGIVRGNEETVLPAASVRCAVFNRMTNGRRDKMKTFWDYVRKE